MKRDERRIHSYDLISVARAEHARPPQMSELIDGLAQMYQRGEASHIRERGSVTYRIGDLTIDNQTQTASLLLRRCDTNAANAVYSDFATGVPRVLAKAANEGGDKAAHLVVSLVAETTKPHHYLCHLENAPGISHRLVQAIFNSILKAAIKGKHATFVYPDPGGARVKGGGLKTTAFVPSIEMAGHPSPQLVHDLERGRITNISLINTAASGLLGGNRYLVQKEERIEVTVQPNLPRQGRVGQLVNAFQTRRRDFDKAIVRFTDPDGLPRSVKYDIDTGAPEQDKYVASYIVSGITPPMDESSVHLVPFLNTAMRTRVVAERS